jgi:hypothetical protein
MMTRHPTPSVFPGPRQTRARGGFTLVELMVVAALGIVFLATAGEIFGWSAFNLIPTMYAEGQLQMELSLASDAFQRDANLAIALPAAQGIYSRDADTVPDNAATIILQVPAVDANGQTLYDTVTGATMRSDYIVYTFNTATGVAQRIVLAYNDPGPPIVQSKRFGEPTRTVANSLSRVTFTWRNTERVTPDPGPGPGPLEITMTAQGTRRVLNRALTLTVPSRSVLRNYVS